MYSQPRPNQPMPLPPHHRSKRRSLPWLLIFAVMGFGGLLMILMIGALMVLALAPDRIPTGVEVAGLSIGGETVEAAEQYLSQNLPLSEIIMVDGARQFPISFADLGVSINIERTLAEAQTARRNAEMPFAYEVDLNQAQLGLVLLSEQVNISATLERAGSVMEIPVMLDRLRTDAAGELADGVFELTMMPTEQLDRASINRSDTARTTHTVEQGQELGLIAREYGVAVDDILELNAIDDPNLIYPGQSLMIPAAGAFQPTAELAPPAPTTRGKSIVVSTEEQRIYAYENGLLVRSHLVSTGRTQTPTVRGDYNIYVKYVADDMRGPDYFLPDVPYTMYFYQGYGIHGTYWHNSFGRPMSHGCVNLPVDEAEWFFSWAEVGTPVRVI